jgi:acyl-CoA synthetase (AMP-forming)/AMP-acid ligase II
VLSGGRLGKLETVGSLDSQWENNGASVVDVTFCDILRRRAAEIPEQQAFVFLDLQGAIADEFTFAALDRRARAIASELVVNCFPGERALLVFPAGLDFVAALCGCFYAGVVAVPIPFLRGKRAAQRISSIRDDADPAVVLTLGELRDDPQVCEAWLGTACKPVWIYTDTLDEQPQDVSLPKPNADTLALLQYTSGSTSSPKGVMLTHGNLIANSAMISGAFGHDETSRGVGWLPLFHDMGLIGHVLQPIYFGGLSVLMSPLSFLQRPARWLQAVSTWKATTSGGPSYAFELCLRSIRDEQLSDLDLSSWRVAYCGSEKVRADVLDRFSKRFARNGFRRQSLLPCFGLAEATLFVTGSQSKTGLKTSACVANPENLAVADPSGPLGTVSCGSPGRGSSVVIADPKFRTRLNDRTVGEIWVQGAHVGQGYWRAPKEDDPFRAKLADESGPYLRTGDLGFMDGRELFVIGRIKDTIIINGLKHSAEDIEALVTGSHMLFANFASAAFSIDVNGQEHAVVVQEVGRAQIRSDELVQAVAAACAIVTRQQGLRLFDLALVRAGSLPRTSSGKIQRSRARDIYLANRFQRLGPTACVLPTNRRVAVTLRS